MLRLWRRWVVEAGAAGSPGVEAVFVTGVPDGANEEEEEEAVPGTVPSIEPEALAEGARERPKEVAWEDPADMPPGAVMEVVVA